MNINMTNEMTSKLLNTKKGVIMGVANKMSLAFHCLETLKKHGADVILTSPNEKMRSRIDPIAAEFGCDVVDCDVTKAGDVENAFQEIKAKFQNIDFVIHAVAFSDKSELQGRYIDTTLANFTNTMHISCYSLVEVAKYAEEILNEHGSIVTLTYYGAEKVIPNYNVMGVAKAGLEASVRYLASDLGPKKKIRCNAISAGPVRTLASSGISDFHQMLKMTERSAPMRENISGRDVGNTALYLVSDLSTMVTGEVLHVDAGSHSVFGSMSGE